MKISAVSMTSVFNDQKRSAENTVNFENCSLFTLYNFENSKKYDSVLGLCDQRNIILEQAVPYLRANSDIKLYNENEAKSFWGKPLALSLAEYGITDYWWLILAVNNYFNAEDFTGWNMLIIPNTAIIESYMDKETYVEKELGYIPEPEHTKH